MREQKFPPEFEKIKPGKFAHQCHAGKEVQILGLPYVSVLEHWIVTVWDGRGSFAVNCDDLVLLDKITLPLTREQAELIQSSLNAFLEQFGYFSNDQYTLREMIKEKLNGL